LIHTQTNQYFYRYKIDRWEGKRELSSDASARRNRKKNVRFRVMSLNNKRSFYGYNR
jgi:hypothetical protein